MTIDEHIDKLLISFPRAIDSSEVGELMEYLGDEMGVTTKFSSHNEWVRNPSENGAEKTSLKARADGEVITDDITQRIEFMSYQENPFEYNAMRLTAPHSPVGGKLLPENIEALADDITQYVEAYFSES